ncbi:MAG: hypothetical protein QOJ38_956 [Solirubrobacterales bacterium]|nr:hypothetical protein [Solirubrobacterales bacterium]
MSAREGKEEIIKANEAKRWGQAALATLGAAAALIAGASAYADDTVPVSPPATPDLNSAQDVCPNANQAASTTACDTEYTPTYKDATEAGWTEIGGARFEGGGRLVENSPTPFTVDFFTTAFRNPSKGFFAGAACRPGTAWTDLDSCDRYPSIYQYRVPPGQSPQIDEVLGPGSSGESKPGYVAQIAWITATKAIAVGGTGHYPRRELARHDGESDADYAARDLAGTEPNAAGRARVWLYDQGSWQELEDLPKTQADQPMSGLTTVDCSPRLLTDGEMCIAGGMRQLWLWQNGRFTKSFTPTSTDASGKPTVDDGAGWRYRVRAVKFSPGDGLPSFQASAVAVTSGCCGANNYEDAPSSLTFDGSKWGNHAAVGLGNGTPTQAVAPRALLPDSFYALSIFANTGTAIVLASDGNPANAATLQAASRFTSVSASRGGSSSSLATDTDATNPRLAGIRLLAIDGDFDRPHTPTPVTSTASGPSQTNPQDRIPDWGVGETLQRGRGVALSTAGTKGSAQVNPVTCTVGTISTQCTARDSETTLAQSRSYSVYIFDSYTLYTFSFVPGGGTAWAGGDRGAIERLGGQGSVTTHTAEPPAPKLGRRQTSRLSADPYADREVADNSSVGSVPSLALKPDTPAREPRLVPSGAPNPRRPASNPDQRVRSIVMSRDGSEGWAIGPGSSHDAPGALFHYDGRWRVCDPDGVPGQRKADPACASLAPLYRYSLGPTAKPLQLITAARVPLERDSDPSNDNDFEVVALGSVYTPPHESQERQVVLRYANGRWDLDPAAMKQIDPGADLQPTFDAIAFSSSSDGWIEAHNTGQVALFHFDGHGWTNCSTNRSACGDQASTLLLGAQGPGPYFLTTAGSRIYYAGTAGALGQATAFIYSLDIKDPGAGWRSEYSATGSLSGFSVAEDEDGGVFGWASGSFDQQGKIHLLRREPRSGEWEPYTTNDASADYLGQSQSQPKLFSDLGENGQPMTVLAPPLLSDNVLPAYPMLRFEDKTGWRVLPTPFPMTPRDDSARWRAVAASVEAVSPDGNGGFWLAARGASPNPGKLARVISFYHYTDRAPKPVFTDVAHPIRQQITATSPGPNGQFWVATNSGVVYRYDRIAGWDKVSVRGWDPGNVVTRVSRANAIAVGPSGDGVLVGEGGRIADINGGSIQLDPAAGAKAICDLDPSASPCGTGRDLRAAAVALDGSAIVAGQAKALLWRARPDAAFQAIRKPDAAISATFTGAAMPSPNTAYLSTDTGEVFHGTLGPGPFDPADPKSGWSWVRENENADGDLVTLDAGGNGIALSALSVDAGGRGYAVGDGGLIIEREPGRDHPWQRIDSGVREDLSSIAQPSNGKGDGVLVGGELGLILTRIDGRFEVARTDDLTDPLTVKTPTYLTARIVGLAMLPGGHDGDVEGWAASQIPTGGFGERTPEPGAVLHYGSRAEMAELSPEHRAEVLPDVTAGTVRELSIAALGRSDCHLQSGSDSCMEFEGTTLTNELQANRAVSDILGGDGSSSPQLTLFTGDVDHAAGGDFGSATPLDADVIHRRWVELVASRFKEAGIPLFGALGAQDLSQLRQCTPFGGCPGTRDLGGAGTSEPWRSSFAAMPAPWGSGPPATNGNLSFAPVGDPGGTNAGEAQGGGARTHYALDIKRDGKPLARLVVLDNSMRSLAASQPNQNPVEAQSDWLDRVLAQRAPGERAIVLDNTPAYAFDTTASGGGVETATDAATLEQTLLKNKVDVVVSGRLGWNGVYWTLAPGLHYPCPGGSPADPNSPPASGTAPSCNQLPSGAPDPQKTADDALAASGDTTAKGALPTVVASGAGGTFGPINHSSETGDAKQGFWHGYSVIHLDPESGKVSVEQRPVFDWIGIQADAHLVRPGQRLPLHGYGREVAGADTPLTYDEISNYAITHRFDLLAADPEKPWLPLTDEKDGDLAHHYVSLDHYLATQPSPDAKPPSIDAQSGQISSGDGAHDRVYALALLSVGEKAATWPLVFEPRPSFTNPGVVQPPIQQPPSLPKPATSPSQSFEPPPLPTAPNFTPPPVSPPDVVTPPLVPPAPPSVTSATPLNLFLSTPGINISPQSTVIPPPAPPIQPAPPGGARKEARQKQAATQSSGADGEQGETGVDAKDAQGSINPMDSSDKAAATRLEPGRDRLAFTALAHRDQPSAWARDALWGGGLALMALTLALGMTTIRPTPRRRMQELPAPAWSTTQRRKK